MFDLLRAGINETTAIAGATASMRERGEVRLDIAAEVQGHWDIFSASKLLTAGTLLRGCSFAMSGCTKLKRCGFSSRCDLSGACGAVASFRRRRKDFFRNSGAGCSVPTAASDDDKPAGYPPHVVLLDCL